MSIFMLTRLSGTTYGFNSLDVNIGDARAYYDITSKLSNSFQKQANTTGSAVIHTASKTKQSWRIKHATIDAMFLPEKEYISNFTLTSFSFRYGEYVARTNAAGHDFDIMIPAHAIVDMINKNQALQNLRWKPTKCNSRVLASFL